MALTVNQAFLSAVGFIKAASTYANVAEELRMANTVNDIITNSNNWSWNLTAGTDIAISAGTQDYSMATANQDKVNAISTANLLSGSTELPELMVGAMILPISATQKQPYAVCLLSETQVRLHPMPDATYTLQFNFHPRATEFAANSESWDIPSNMADVAKAGMIWQVLAYGNEDQADKWEAKFFRFLKDKILTDKRRIGKRA